tara:strand:+ start:280 stop:972 length:693 start_codon:yes stop_codon:yes gene_type:complete
MSILALIPARGGSKGIPNKNLQKIGRNTLLKQTITHAKQSSLIDRIIVSTDSKKIKEEAIRNGAEVPFLRPKKISTSNATTFQVINHTIEFLKNQNEDLPEIIVILQPTTPFREKNLIDNSIKKLKLDCATSVISVSAVKSHPSILFSKYTKFLVPFDRNFEANTIRQKRKKLYYPNGSVYTFWTKNIQKFNSIYGPKISSVIIDEQKYSIDIDTNFELSLANLIQRFLK